jgi:hypothetical protein
VEEVGAYLNLLEHGASMVIDPEPQPGLTPDPGDDYLIAWQGPLPLTFWCPVTLI